MTIESQALLKLQEIDIELMRINSQLKAMPQQKKLEAIQAAKKNLSDKLRSIVGQRKDAEMELEENEAAQLKTSTRIDEVQAEAYERSQDFRGVRDLEAHLTALAKQLEKQEFKHKELASDLERLRKAEQNALGLAERLEQERETTQASFEQDTSDLMARVRILAGERKQALADMSDDVIARYGRASKRFGGLAVERLRGNVPTTCRVKLQQGLFNELMHGPVISECPYCHRMLVTEGALVDE